MDIKTLCVWQRQCDASIIVSVGLLSCGSVEFVFDICTVLQDVTQKVWNIEEVILTAYCGLWPSKCYLESKMNKSNC